MHACDDDKFPAVKKNPLAEFELLKLMSVKLTLFYNLIDLLGF